MIEKTTNRDFIYDVWGGLDIIHVIWYALISIINNRVPYWTDFENMRQNISIIGGVEVTLFVFVVPSISIYCYKL